MDGWRPIERAPKDGRLLRLKREYDGRVVAEGNGRFGLLHEAAPARRPLGSAPVGRLSPEAYERAAHASEQWASTPRWVTADRLYAFPVPTHWMPPVPYPDGAA